MSDRTISEYPHYKGYQEARTTVLGQSTEDDLATIDSLFGRGELPEDAGPNAIKDEALRQMEIDWRVPERWWTDRDHQIRFWNAVLPLLPKE